MFSKRFAETGKIGCVGEYDVVFPFKSMSFDVAAVSDSNEAFKAVEKFIQEKYSIILVQEKFLTAIHELIMETYALPLPTIIAIPGTEGSLGIALNSIKEVVKRAVGKDLLSPPSK